MFWADEIAKKLIAKNKENTIATGITPSGYIHVGNLREITVGDVLNRAILKLGKPSKLIWISDDFDRLRKVYPFLPESYSQYIGRALTAIPDFELDGHESYAEHFVSDFVSNFPKLGIGVEVISATKQYQTGIFTDKITTALKEKLKIKKILEDVSGRTLHDDYSPYVVYCGECGKDFTKIVEEDLDNHRVKYVCEFGHQGWADYSRAQGKLSWRVDWPARWGIFKVTAEPLGKDHATTGGSYDTAKLISEEVFNYPAPEKVFYENILLKGTKGKMSSSLGNVVSSTDMLKIVPPPVLRYMLIKAKERHFTLDPADGLIQLIDEFTRLEEKVERGDATPEEKVLYEYSNVSGIQAQSHVPFNHLVNVFQSAQGNIDEVIRLLKRTEHIKNEESIKADLDRVANWIKDYAPDRVKFTVQKELPTETENLTQAQGLLLQSLIEKVDSELDPEKFHNFIYETGKKLNLSPKQTFEAIYIVFLNKSSGPKAGWFLKTLDKDFVIKRLKEAVNSI